MHAADGQQAQAMIDQMPPPALVLLDIMLPYLNGLQLLAHIRQKAEWQHVPIIMLTADSNERAIEQALLVVASLCHRAMPRWRGLTRINISQ